MFRILSSTFVSLSLCGCAGWFMAQGPAARGVWLGTLNQVTLFTDDGRAVAAPVILIDAGPVMTSPHSPGTELRVARAVLVDRDDRIVPIDPSLIGAKIRASGQMQGRIIFDKGGHQLGYSTKRGGLAALRLNHPVQPEKADNSF